MSIKPRQKLTVTVVSLVVFCVSVLSFSFISGCGRYIAARAPETLIPAAIKELQAAWNPEGTVLLMAWTIPENDISGKKMKETIGYRIEKAEGGKQSILTDVPLEKQFTEVAFIPDTYFEKLRKKQDETEERGGIVRKTKLTGEDRTVRYQLTDVPQGITLYRVYAVNSEGGDGDIALAVEVTNDGPIRSAVIAKQVREKH